MHCCPNKWKTLLSHKGGSGWHLRPVVATSSKIYTVDVVMAGVDRRRAMGEVDMTIWS